jgi:hypothetical protein
LTGEFHRDELREHDDVLEVDIDQRRPELACNLLDEFVHSEIGLLGIRRRKE